MRGLIYVTDQCFVPLGELSAGDYLIKRLSSFFFTTDGNQKWKLVECQDSGLFKANRLYKWKDT